MVTGRVQKTICWLLMEEGQLTGEGVHELADFYVGSLRVALDELIKKSLAQREKKIAKNGKRLWHFGLTRQGIDGAQYIERDEIQEYLRSKK